MTVEINIDKMSESEKVRYSIDKAHEFFSGEGPYVGGDREGMKELVLGGVRNFNNLSEKTDDEVVKFYSDLNTFLCEEKGLDSSFVLDDFKMVIAEAFSLQDNLGEGNCLGPLPDKTFESLFGKLLETNANVRNTPNIELISALSMCNDTVTESRLNSLLVDHTKKSNLTFSQTKDQMTGASTDSGLLECLDGLTNVHAIKIAYGSKIYEHAKRRSEAPDGMDENESMSRDSFISTNDGLDNYHELLKNNEYFSFAGMLRDSTPLEIDELLQTSSCRDGDFSACAEDLGNNSDKKSANIKRGNRVDIESLNEKFDREYFEGKMNYHNSASSLKVYGFTASCRESLGRNKILFKPRLLSVYQTDGTGQNPTGLVFSASFGKVSFEPAFETDASAIESSILLAKSKDWGGLYLNHGGTSAEASSYFEAVLKTLSEMSPVRPYQFDDVHLPKEFKDLKNKYMNKASMGSNDNVETVQEKLSKTLDPRTDAERNYSKEAWNGNAVPEGEKSDPLKVVNNQDGNKTESKRLESVVSIPTETLDSTSPDDQHEAPVPVVRKEKFRSNGG
jgi:hypothetical protein